MTDDSSPEWMWRRSECPWCRQDASIKLIHWGRREYNFSAWEDTHIGNHGGMYFLGECQKCGNPLMFKEALCSGPDEFPYASLEWPTWHPLAHGTSETIKAIFRRAYLIQKRSPAAFVTQIRRAVEALLDDLGTERAPLRKRIQLAAQDHHLPPAVVEALDLLRRLGNAATHHPAADISYLYTHTTATLFCVVIEYVYGLPYNLGQAREALARIEEGQDKASHE